MKIQFLCRPGSVSVQTKKSPAEGRLKLARLKLAHQ